MNDAVNLTSRSFLTISVPYWQPASPLTWFMTWVQPGIALFGVVLNAIVVLIIGLVPGRRLAEVTRASRVYYVVISSAELVSLVVGYLCRQSIPIASLLISGGKSMILTTKGSIFGCKIVLTIWLASDYAALLAFSCLAIERTIAVYWPLKSKHILGPRFTVLLLLAVPGLCVIAFSPIFYLVYTIHLFPTYAQLPVCLADVSSPVYIYYVLTMEIIPLFSVLILLGFTPAVAFKLLKMSKERSKMLMGHAVQTLSSRDMGAAITMISLGISYEAFMFPFSVLWGLYNALSYVAPTSSVTNVLFTLANYATELALVPSCFHFFVYIVLIRAFRDRLSCTRVSASAYSGNTNRSEL